MTEDTGPSTKTNEDRLPWRGIAAGGAALLALFVAAPLIQIWIDSIPRYEQRPSIPLAAHPLPGDAGVVRLPGDGKFVAAALNEPDYIEYFRLLEVVVHSEEPVEVDEATAKLDRMYDEGALIKLMSGAELAVVGGDAFIAQVRVDLGATRGRRGLAVQRVRQPAEVTGRRPQSRTPDPARPAGGPPAPGLGFEVAAARASLCQIA